MLVYGICVHVHIYIYIDTCWFAVHPSSENCPGKSSTNGCPHQTLKLPEGCCSFLFEGKLKGSSNKLVDVQFHFKGHPHQGEMRRPSILWPTCPLFGCTSLVAVKNQTWVCLKTWVHLGWAVLIYQNIPKNVYLDMLNGNLGVDWSSFMGKTMRIRWISTIFLGLPVLAHPGQLDPGHDAVAKVIESVKKILCKQLGTTRRVIFHS